MTSADHYLTIPAGSPWRWSRGCDAIEDDAGATLCVHEELKLLLEGVFSTDERPPFAWLLDLLAWCRRPDAPPTDPPADQVWERLRPLVVAAKPTARNLGLLAAFLCEGLPQAVVAPAWPELSATMDRRRMFGERATTHQLPGPPLSRGAFAERIDRRLRQVSNRQLVGLLLAGESNPPDPAPVAEALASFPERLGAMLAEFRRRERLVGAAFLAPAIDGALALPPRRPRADRLPQGGYADVTTRGIPDRLLPSQFALDDDEFVRRFAEHELLYFRREEPHEPRKPSRVLLLDQGVRTWGHVRLGLAGAAVAVLTKDPARFQAVAFGTTSHDDFLDPWAVSPGELASHLERSDLSAHPADLLERALRLPADGPRDLVLLTHPRNARELAVRETLLDLAPDDRLFVLTLNETGDAELLEADERGLRSLRRFRVDLAGAAAVKVAARATPPGRALPVWSARPWTGDIEPVPFPFRAGLVTDIDRLITFDADAAWVVVLGRDGALHAKRVNSDESLEVLPRPKRRGVGLYLAVSGLTPSRGGVTVTYAGLGAVAHARYDFETRRMTLADPGGPNPPAEFAELLHQERLPRLCVVGQGDVGPLPDVRVVAGGLQLTLPGGVRTVLTPTADGKPAFEGANLTKAVYAAGTLAVVAARGNDTTLWVLNTADSAVLHHQSAVGPERALTLSPDGRWLARQAVGRAVEVRALSGAGVERLKNGGYHNHAAFHLTAESLSVRVGRYQHRFWLNRVPFEYEAGDASMALNLKASHPETAVTAYDAGRFTAPVEAGPWLAAYDRWGQIVLMNRAGRLVMLACVCRGQWAVALPDGTRCGAASLLGGAPTPDAERLIGEALRRAAEE